MVGYRYSKIKFNAFVYVFNFLLSETKIALGV